MAEKLDCRGLECPQPVMRCREILNESPPSELLVIVDNTAAVENVSRYLQNNGYTTSVRHDSVNEWRIGARRESSGASAEPVAPEEKAAGAKTLVLLTTETLGRGDDELGAKLMVNFLGSLGELGGDLWRIILLNGAVKLAARQGEPLEHLEKLAAAGVSILVCGTCLMHYGLMEQKKVGDTTNMMDVVTSLSLADKVIRP